MARKKRRRRIKAPRVSQAESDRATAAKEGLRVGQFGTAYSWIAPRRPAPPSGADLLRADQDNPPVVVR